jgi:hypothetical protein
MAFIDSTYFIGEILITDKTAIAADLDQAIAQYEKGILISGLGYELYQLTVNNPTIEPYKSLIEGAEFELTFEGITQTIKWEGFKNSIKESLIAYYTYYRWEERNFLKPSGVGIIKPMAENSQVMPPNIKMVQAWNNFVKRYGEFPICWFYHNYGSKIIQPTANEHYNDYPSMYNYLLVNKEDFPKWVFKPIEMTNVFGI